MRRGIRKTCMAAVIVCGAVILLGGCGKADKNYDKAMELLDKSSYEESLEYFENAIELNDEKAEYYIGYGMALNNLGRYEEAIQEFSKAFQDVDNKISRDNNKQLYYGQAIADYGLKDYDSAIDECTKALEISQLTDLDNDISKLKAVAQQLSGDTDAALETYSAILKDNSKDSEVYNLRAALYIQIEDYDKAAADYQKAVDVDSTCYDAYFGLYQVYEQRGNDTDAQDILGKVTSIKADKADEKMQVGKAYYYLDDYKQAQTHLEEAVSAGSVDAKYYQGMILMAEADYSGAQSKFNEYISNSSTINIPEVYNQLAGCAIELKDYDAAATYITDGLSLGSTSAERLLYKNQVILYEKTGKYKKARKVAKAYVAAYPDDTEMQKELKFIKTRISTMKLSESSSN